MTAHLPRKGKRIVIWMGEDPWPIGAGDNDPDSLGFGGECPFTGGSAARAAGTRPSLPLREAGGRAPRPCPLSPGRPEGAAAQMGCWRPQRQRRGYQRSSQMGRPPSELAAPTPRGLQPRPLGSEGGGGGASGSALCLPPPSLAVPSPRGPGPGGRRRGRGRGQVHFS